MRSATFRIIAIVWLTVGLGLSFAGSKAVKHVCGPDASITYGEIAHMTVIWPVAIPVAIMFPREKAERESNAVFCAKHGGAA